MSVNFGYGGYGMMNNTGVQGMNNNNGNNGFHGLTSQYNCPTCYQSGVIPYNLKTDVNPLPPYSNHQSWISRVIKRFLGL